MPKEGSVKFLINIFEGSGEFEICEGGSVAVSGKIYVPEDVSKEMLKLPKLEVPVEKDILPLSTVDIYKELRLRGYDYSGAFKGITESDNYGRNGKLKWDNNWISFVDTMLQFSILGQNTRELYLPTRLQKAIINPKLHTQLITSLPEGENISVHMYRDIGIIKCGGIELRGMKASLAPRRQQAQSAPKLEKYQFIPFETTQPTYEDYDGAKLHILTGLMQLVLENSSGALKLKIAEVASERPLESLLAVKIKDILEKEPMLSIDYIVVSSGPIDTTLLEPAGIKTALKDINTNQIEQNAHLIVLADILIYKKIKVLQNAVDSLKTGGFILLEEIKDSIDEKFISSAGLQIISQQMAGNKIYLLLRKPTDIPADPITINITENHFSWVEPLKEALKKSETDKTKIFLITQGEELTGLVGMVNCIKQEPGGENVRAFFIQDQKAEKFTITSKYYLKQLKKDLVHNVLKNGVWGSYKHILLDRVSDSGTLQVEHAYINTLTRGDLASLRWIEGPLTYYK